MVIPKTFGGDVCILSDILFKKVDDVMTMMRE